MLKFTSLEIFVYKYSLTFTLKSVNTCLDKNKQEKRIILLSIFQGGNNTISRRKSLNKEAANYILEVNIMQ